MRANRSMAWARHDAVLFVLHAPGEPRAEDWEEFIKDVRSERGLRGLIVTVGDSRPTPKQRGDIQQWFKEAGLRAAVLTDSMLARGAITAMRWFDLPIKAFATEKESDAFEFVEINPSDLGAARSIILRLKQALAQRST